MKILKKIKENLFIILVALAYVAIFIFRTELGTTSVKNSAYYLKEMLLIMPPIFLLTALLDSWVPKEKITQFLGHGAGIKGTVLSFVLGSVSAGPVYAAFPFCVMLLKKGASIKNIVIILSSWAVIKIPMLLNEAKFLGLKFMAMRYVLTVIAILIFSWLTAKLVKKEDLNVSEHGTGLAIDKKACIGCELCEREYPEVFEMQGKKAHLKDVEEGELDKEKLSAVIEACPPKAISYEEPKKKES